MNTIERVVDRVLLGALTIVSVICILCKVRVVENIVFLLGELVAVVLYKLAIKSQRNKPARQEPADAKLSPRSKQFIAALQEVIACAEEELSRIDAGEDSLWTACDIRNTVLKEATELLDFARKGKILHKYGDLSNKLDSVELLRSSEKALLSTTLGRKILRMKELYEEQ